MSAYSNHLLSHFLIFVLIIFSVFWLFYTLSMWQDRQPWKNCWDSIKVWFSYFLLAIEYGELILTLTEKIHLLFNAVGLNQRKLLLNNLAHMLLPLFCFSVSELIILQVSFSGPHSPEDAICNIQGQVQKGAAGHPLWDSGNRPNRDGSWSPQRACKLSTYTRGLCLGDVVKISEASGNDVDWYPLVVLLWSLSVSRHISHK